MTLTAQAAASAFPWHRVFPFALLTFSGWGPKQGTTIRIRRLPILAVCLVLLFPIPAVSEDLTNIRWDGCYDGDTCTVTLPNVPAVFGRHLPIRLRGIDAPEIKGRCSQEIEAATNARDYLTSRLRSARELVLHNVSRDKYFRLDAIVVADGVNLNEDMVTRGYARPYDGEARQGWCP